jgi:hypothetical protein
VFWCVCVCVCVCVLAWELLCMHAGLSSKAIQYQVTAVIALGSSALL